MRSTASARRIAFSPAEIARVFDAARRLGLPVKLHAEQLSNQGGAALAASHSARLSADHLEYLDDAGVAAMARGGHGRRAAAGRLLYAARDAGAAGRRPCASIASPIAVATDSNPGTSPLTSLLLTLNMAATLFRLTVDECLLGVDARCGARARARKRARLA